MAYMRHLDNRRIAISRQRIFTKFSTMIHNDPLNPTGPNDMLFAGQTHVCQRAIILVAVARWRLLANAIEASMCSNDAAFFQITLTTCSYYYHYV